MSRVLVVDDDRNLLKVVAAILKEDGHEVVTCDSAERAWEQFAAAAPDAVVVDLQMPGWDGLELLRRVRGSRAELPVILLTAHGSIEAAVTAMKDGAYDFLSKPVESEKLVVTVRNALASATLIAENRRLRERRRRELEAELVGASPALERVRDLVTRVATHDATVLLTGETGTGKEVAARMIHALSARAAGPFVPVNCAALPETLVESELFGHARGAFTGAVRERRGRFEEAAEGTIFLDEVGDLPAAAQAKLLRALEARTIRRLGEERERTVDVRVVTATNRDLEAAVKTGAFREDLFYRLNVFPVQLPPLRERREDLPALAAHFLAQFARPDEPPVLAPDALRLLLEHSWPGNVRELRNVLERAVVLADEDEIRPEHLAGLGPAAAAPAADQAEPGLDLEIMERTLIRQALDRSGGNQTQAAKLLGITRSALIYRMEKHGIG